jgi:hypothetical protein
MGVFELTTALNRRSLYRTFRSDGRLHIPSILRPQDAQALYRYLSEHTQWGIDAGIRSRHRPAMRSP